jgi:hypothetical protein
MSHLLSDIEADRLEIMLVALGIFLLVLLLAVVIWVGASNRRRPQLRPQQVTTNHFWSHRRRSEPAPAQQDPESFV